MIEFIFLWEFRGSRDVRPKKTNIVIDFLQTSPTRSNQTNTNRNQFENEWGLLFHSFPKFINY